MIAIRMFPRSPLYNSRVRHRSISRRCQSIANTIPSCRHFKAEMNARNTGCVERQAEIV